MVPEGVSALKGPYVMHTASVTQPCFLSYALLALPPWPWPCFLIPAY
jgi:hypothetical protein